MHFTGGAVAVIDPIRCQGCGVCEQVCRFDAILPPLPMGDGLRARVFTLLTPLPAMAAQPVSTSVPRVLSIWCPNLPGMVSIAKSLRDAVSCGSVPGARKLREAGHARQAKCAFTCQ